LGLCGQVVFDAEFFKSSTARQLHSVVVVDVDHQNLHRITNTAYCIDARYVAARKLANVAQSIFAREYLDERSKVPNARDDTVVDLADLNRCGACFHPAQRSLGRFGVRASHGDVSFIVNVDRCSSILLDRADVLATRSDQQTNLVRIDFGSEQSGCVAADLRAWTRDTSEHLSQDLDAGIASLLESRSNDLLADPIDLQVQLNTGDPVLGTRDFEVHIAMMVFVTDDIRQQDVIVFVPHQSDADACNRVGDWNPCGHEAEAPAANRSHRRGPIALQNIADDPHGVGEIIWIGQDCLERTLGEHPVPDLASSRTTIGLALADREGWEVVVEHEFLAVLIHQPVDSLFVARCSERHGDEGLGLTSLEQCGSMGARQQIRFAMDRTQALGVPPVASGSSQDQIANDLVF
jgi:hypothetical protein